MHEGTACVDIRVSPSHVELKTSSNGDCLRARAAVLACGHNPEMTKKLRLGEIAHYYEGAQAEILMDDLSVTEIYLGRNVAPFFFCVGCGP